MNATTRAVALTLLLALAGALTSALAQERPTPPAADSLRLAAARQLLAASGAVDIMVGAMKANLPAAQKAAPPLPTEFWTRLLDTLSRGAPELLDSVAVVYASTFSLEDLRELTAFYESPLGRRLRAAQPGILAQSTAVGQRWGARIGAAVGASLRRN